MSLHAFCVSRRRPTYTPSDHKVFIFTFIVPLTQQEYVAKQLSVGACMRHRETTVIERIFQEM